MHPHFANVPLWIFALLMGGALGATLSGKNLRANLIGGIGGAVLAGVIALLLPAGHNQLPVQGYGVMVLIGFVSAVYLAERRMPLIGVKPFHVLDMGLTGAVLGILGARIFYVAMTWSEFDPFGPNGFDASKLVKMLYIWQGGLVFYGAFATALPWCIYYCIKHKIPVLKFLDIAAPGLILGLAFGRIGCLLTGCCFGSVCNLPWALRFPPGSPAFESQLKLGMISATASSSLPVHPTQIYASVAAFLTYIFLSLYWPRRKYDGQVLSLMLIMAGATRFFEEMLRADDIPPFPALSQSWTIAQWVALPLMVAGVGLLFYFRNRAATVSLGNA